MNKKNIAKNAATFTLCLAISAAVVLTVPQFTEHNVTKMIGTPAENDATIDNTITPEDSKSKTDESVTGNSGKTTTITDEATPEGSKPKAKTKKTKKTVKTSDPSYVVSDYDQQLIDQCNAQRVAAGVPAIPVSTRLCKDAAVRAEETSRVWEHTRPDGTDWWTVDEAYMNGENIAYGYTSSAENVLAWVNSPHHYENMIEPRFNSCGCYTYIDSNGTTYTVFEYSTSGPAF